MSKPPFNAKSVRGEYPEGRLNPHDLGAQQLAIGVENGKVVIHFPAPTKWIGFTPDGAVDLALAIFKHAIAAGSTKGLSIELPTRRQPK